MTAPPSDDAGSGSTPEKADGDPRTRLLGLGLDLPSRGTGARAARRRVAARPLTAGPPPDEQPSDRQHDQRAPAPRPRSPATERSAWQRWRPAAFVAALAVLVLAGAALTLAGYRVVRDSTAGRTIDPSREPVDPGFEAIVEPSPTLLALGRGPDGSLSWAALLALQSTDPEAAGSVVVLPTGLLVGEEGSAGPLADVAATGGAEGARRAVEVRLQIAIPDVVELDGAQLGALVAPVAPLELEGAAAVDEFPAGDLQLGANQVGPYLAARGAPDTAEAQRLARQEDVWDAWAAALAEGGPEAIPGEVGAGIGRFLRGLALGAPQAQTLPVVEEPAVGTDARYTPDPDAAPFVLADAVPFPTAATPGGRTRVRLLDGTGSIDVAHLVAPTLVAGGAEIVIVGNAPVLGHEQSEVIYHRSELAYVANVFAYLLELPSSREEIRPTDFYDVTVVIGSSFQATPATIDGGEPTERSDSG